MKYEWRKHDKNLYSAKKTPALVIIPVQNYIMLSGKGDPNDADFSNRVAALYALAYAIKMGYKAAAAKESQSATIHDYAVYPLEGIWKRKDEGPLVKAALEYTIMIRQPDFITEAMVCTALQRVKEKKPAPFLDEICFAAMQDGKCVEILHIGAYDDEPASFEKMDQFAAAHNLKRTESFHREIYLNNAKRVEKSKLKTILRYAVTE